MNARTPFVDHLSVALRLAAAGLAVFPVNVVTKEPAPGVRWRHESTRDPTKVRNMWAAHLGAGVAIDLGKSGLVVIDCDRHPGGPDGVRAFNELAASHGGIDANVPIVFTGGGGYHCYFRNTDDKPLRCSPGDLPKAVDCKGVGGYVIAPGTVRQDGTGWRRAEGRPDVAESLATGTIPCIPDWLVNIIRSTRDKVPALSPSSNREAPTRGEIQYALAALRNECSKVAETAIGGRNDALNTAAFSVGTCVGAEWIERSDCEAALSEAALQCGLTTEEARPTITSGLNAGAKNPRPPLGQRSASEMFADTPMYGSSGFAGGKAYYESAPRDFSSVDRAWPVPKPLPDGLSPVEQFRSEFLPASLAPWAADIAERMQCPLDYVGVAALVGAGSLIGRKIGIRPQRRTDWTEVPNLWGCVVGRPGAMKSPAIAEALKPLHRIEARALEKNEVEQAEYERAIELHKLKSDAVRDAVKAAIKSNKTPTMLSTDERPAKPPTIRYVVNDTSYEKLGEIMQDNPNGILAHRDELVSLLRTLDREEQASARGFYLTAWGGQDGYVFDRIGRGTTRIKAACLSLLGSTQPARLAVYIGRAVSGVGDDGLIQRFGLLVWPDQSPDWRAYDRYPDTVAREGASGVFDRLAAFDPAGGQFEQGEFDAIPFVRFDEAAQATFAEWHANLERRLRAAEMSPALESHLSKYRKLVPSLALVNHFADGLTGPVGEGALLRALALAEYLETHARRAYGAGIDRETQTAKAILSRIRKGDLAEGFTARDIHQRGWAHLSDRAGIAAGLALLEDLDWIAGATFSTGGRPRTTYRINPRARQ